MSGGPVVATDDSGTGHVQIVKLAYSADGSRTPITADTNGLKVNVGNTVTVSLGAALPAGSNVIGAVTQSGTWNVGSITTLPSLPAGANTIGAVTQASGPWTVVERGATIAHGQGSVTTSAAQFLASGSTRRSVTIQNLGNDYVYIGATGITANNGIRLSPGQTLVIDKSPNAAIFAIAASGTQTCSYLTESD
ncbi:MAG: hypothetical protein EB141_00225 [Verrucomicrobia bacterium]|nr:hypothetical protein [Pseudomonadota bacterium]NDA65125.1 hypothetical protein [Verrucomicrobiota bacterium]NDB74071.1 hypothetical protein [Verrucomicrobiota bacterium]NDD37003.1 hypothetical protein [Verrucomicrobiota bacterium]NDE96788.1 hypothetical protein [Verrucomicrobiota bacterium]